MVSPEQPNTHVARKRIIQISNDIVLREYIRPPLFRSVAYSANVYIKPWIDFFSQPVSGGKRSGKAKGDGFTREGLCGGAGGEAVFSAVEVAVAAVGAEDDCFVQAAVAGIRIALFVLVGVCVAVLEEGVGVAAGHRWVPFPAVDPVLPPVQAGDELPGTTGAVNLSPPSPILH